MSSVASALQSSAKIRELLLDIHTRRFQLAAAIQSIHDMLEYLNATEPHGDADRRGHLLEDLARQDRSMQALERTVVAATRLSECASLDDLSIAIEEILSALIGCEDFVVVSIPASGKPFVVAESRATPELIAGVMGEHTSAAVPSSYVHDAPLKNGQTVVGRIVLFHLLPQKSKLSSADMSLLEVLSSAVAILLPELSADTMERTQ